MVDDTNMQSTTRLESLSLKNYRGFESLDMDLHPNLTVIVATNGSGKTAVLDAIAACWSYFVEGIEGRPPFAPFLGSDTRRVIGPDGSMEAVTPTEIRAAGLIDGHDFDAEWSFRPSSSSPMASGVDTADLLIEAGKKLSEGAQKFAAGQRSSAPVLPLIRYYGTARLWPVVGSGSVEPAAEELRFTHVDRTSRLAGYTGCLANASRFQSFAKWFERFSREAQQESATKRASPHRPALRLEAVRSAVDVLLRPTGWHAVEWDFAMEAVVASHPVYGRLPVSQLSDGVRNTLGLVADLAHRSTRLNPQFGAGAARLTPGLVLIDEVDMHLHPGWQQMIVSALREAFPLVQFIVTTHSPQVLSTVPAECIRIIEMDGHQARVSTPGAQTLGVESATLLSEVMGVDPIPDVEPARLLSEYRALIEAGAFDSEKAGELRERLERHFGAAHQLLRDCDRLIRLTRFKQTLPRDLDSDRKE